MNQVLAGNESFYDLEVSYKKLLNFSCHINKICCKASQRAKLILKAFSSCDPNLLMRVLITFMKHIFEYASCIWSLF